jgi:GAF domain-containing protein
VWLVSRAGTDPAARGVGGLREGCCRAAELAGRRRAWPAGRPAAGSRCAAAGVGDLLPASGEPAAEALLAVPLRSSSRLIGVLAVYDRADGQPFDEADLSTLRTFTSQATVAVDNVLLHEEARRLSVTDALTGCGTTATSR